jgi:hypothetical protein
MRFGLGAILLGLLALGCSGDDGDDANTDGTSLEIIGEYTDNFGGDQIITADDWNGSAIKGFDNGKNVVYTQFPDDDMFSPSLFAKTVYTEPKDDAFYFCMVVFDAETLAEAKASDASADEDDLEEGCGGFEWSLATKN